jgi:hypothetical protein
MAERLFNETPKTALENARKWAGKEFYKVGVNGTIERYKFGEFNNSPMLNVYKWYDEKKESSFNQKAAFYDVLENRRISPEDNFLSEDDAKEKSKKILDAVETKLKPLIGKTLYMLKRDGTVRNLTITENFTAEEDGYKKESLFIDHNTLNVMVSRYVPITYEAGSEDNNIHETHELNDKWQEFSAFFLEGDDGYDGYDDPDYHDPDYSPYDDNVEDKPYEALYTFDEDLLNLELKRIKSETNK